ncbi:MAG TPA: spondin domain-containing protein [Phycisphaerales bacterium]|nr:spondin domain-containing protein [Phycisphaerales bacterium]
MMKRTASVLIALAAGAGSAGAQPVPVEVTIQNLSPMNGAALSPFTVAFHDGAWDAFDAGSAASQGVRLVAELGDGSQYISDFMAAQPQGVAGTVVATTNGFGPGIFLPNGSGSMVFDVDPAVNRYFSFGSMVVPSNDRFVGNDAGTAIELFDAGGNFVGSTVVVLGSEIWDAGTEVDGHFGAAFIEGQDAMDHVDQGGVIALNNDFSIYDGAPTPAGYDFVDLPNDNGGVVRISFRVIPAPSALALLGFAGAVAARRRR